MKIISWNVNGIRAIVKKDFFQDLKKMNPDILCIQETKAQDDAVTKSLFQLSNYNIYVNSAVKKGYSGTVILSKIKPISIVYGMGIPKHDKEGRIICAEYKDYYLINVYVPNSGQHLERLDYRKQWDEDFLRYLQHLEKEKPLIVAGDFNVAHQTIDLKNDKTNYNKTAGYTQVEIDGMDNFINAGFIDAFREIHSNAEAYTYWSYRFKARERNIGWRIDYFLMSKYLINKIETINILSEYYGSDHCPIGLEINS
ncbi:MAG: exodeoxyribonuclease III [Algibacter sp.]|uniref:exodeoxyribonuclease III n=1 Tax=Algibacter sp. TaxID=1872428 RepID=UPI0026088592|nr:exodeoxyribonuclease III [Algibacter sp.]MDG1729458.1 exodeoxyribonuclease III [Algibacter sp.]MDG2178644.1 exodeoxyribonuclease III [Algibacter sp.]